MEKEQGVVKWFSKAKGYGFIERSFGGADAFDVIMGVKQEVA